MLEPPPEVDLGLQLYMDAFWLLCQDRGPLNRITWTSVHLYSRSLGLSAEEEHDMLFYLNRLDIEYVKWAQKQGKKNGPQGPSDEDGSTVTPNSRKRKAGAKADGIGH